MKIKKRSTYDDSNIEKLKGLDPVKKRPGMYIGDVTSADGIYQITKEVIDNSIDEYMSGNCFVIDVVMDIAKNEVAVVDNGRGIPQKSIVKVLTELHAGGKFDSKAYTVSGGLHGIGISATNALSTKLICYSKRGSKIVCAKFKNGGAVIHAEKTVSKVENIPILKHTQAYSPSWKTGTIIVFSPDYNILTYGKLAPKEIMLWLGSIPKLCAGLKINVTVLMGKKKLNKVFYSRKGYEAEAKVNDFYYSGNQVECFASLGEGDFRGYVNTIPTNEGSHITGFFRALKSALAPYIKKTSPSPKVLRETIAGVIHVKVHSPNFIGQVKEKLKDSKVEQMVFEVLKDELSRFFNKKPKVARKIVNTANQLQAMDDSRKTKLKALRGVESASKHGKLPIELAVSLTKDFRKRELFIVEGESAGGSAKAARDRDYQEVLPLGGKPPNACKKSLADILASEIKNIILAIGDEDPTKARVGRVVFLADPDPDGGHITALLCTAFITLFPKWLEFGKVYAVDAPLFHALYKNKRYFGDTASEVIKQTSKGCNVMRTKGWGEVRPDDLRFIAFDPKTRKLIKLLSNSKTIKKALNIMGKEVEFRRKLLGL